VGTAGVGERDEHVVVEPGRIVAVVHLGVDGRYRPEELEGLVDEVATEVEQGATAGGGGTVLTALESRLEPGDVAEGSAVGEGADGAEVESQRRF
jgi:hypothetical protein